MFEEEAQKQYEQQLNNGEKLAVFYMDKQHTQICGSSWSLNGFLEKKNVTKVIFMQGKTKDQDSYHVFYKWTNLNLSNIRILVVKGNLIASIEQCNMTNIGGAIWKIKLIAIC